MKYLIGLFFAIAHAFAGAVVVVYVNGGSAPVDGVYPQALAFANSITIHGVPKSYDLRFFPIAQTSLETAEAISCQRELSKEAFPTSTTLPNESEYIGYLSNLGRAYQNFTRSILLNPIACPLTGGVGRMGYVTRVLSETLSKLMQSDETVVLVGYSQGNNYIEAAVALLVASGEIKNLDKIRYVGIASPAFTKLGGAYVNGTLDSVVYGTLKSNYSLAGNTTFCRVTTGCLIGATATELLVVGASSNLHFLADNYLNRRISSIEHNESIPKTIAREIVIAATKSLSLKISDEFNGPYYDSAFWIYADACGNSFPSTPNINGGILRLEACGILYGKVLVHSPKIVIEVRMATQNLSGRLNMLTLFSSIPLGMLSIGESSLPGGGLSIIGAGLFQTSNFYASTSTDAMKSYRITIEDKNVMVQRGDSLNTLTETYTATLATTIDSAQVNVLLRMGATSNSAPVDYDWIRVYAY